MSWNIVILCIVLIVVVDMKLTDPIVGLGWKRIDIILSRKSINDNFRFLKDLSLIGVAARANHYMSEESGLCSTDNGAHGLVIVTTGFKPVDVFKCATNRRPYLTLIAGNSSTEVYQPLLDSIEKTTSLYHYSQSHKSMDLVFTSKVQSNPAVINPVHVKREDSSKIWLDVKPNLEGTVIRGVSLSWLPWLEIEDCNQEGRECKVCRGLMYDMIPVFEQMFNFTIECVQEQNGDWGSTPKTGWWLDANATFGGVLGSVINGDNDLALTSYSMVWERFDWLDFSVGLKNKPYDMFFNLAITPFDLVLILRPFTTTGWQVLLGMFIVISLVLAFFRFVEVKHFEPDMSSKIVLLTAWTMFVVVHGYYSGALTMYFTVSSGLPFRTFKEGLLQYPTWKIVTVKGEEFYLEREKDDPVIAGYLNIIDQNLDDLRAGSIREGIERLNQRGHILRTSGFAFVSTVLQNPGIDSKMNLQSINDQYISSLLLATRHSPYTRLLSGGVLAMTQSGKMDALYKKWIGKLPVNKNNDAVMMNFKELILVFGFMLLSSSLALASLGFEHLFHYWDNLKGDQTN